MSDGVLKKGGQVGDIMVINTRTNEPVLGDVVPMDVPIGVKTGLPQMHKQPPVELSLGAVGQMVVMGLADGGKGKNKYAPKKCEHGR
jgi:hypothetical protein